jgi:DNA-directed RNA polymerase II subunit RPB2
MERVFDSWSLIDQYYDHYGTTAFTKHHTQSYDAFVQDQMRRTIASMNPIAVPVANKLEVWVGGHEGRDVFLSKPKHRPQQCRVEGKTYASEVSAHLTFTFETRAGDRVAVEERVVRDVPLCSLPVMLKSAACLLRGESETALRASGEDALELGGYFIVQGLEKVVISQERNAANRLFVQASDRDPFSHTATLRTVADRSEDALTLFPRVLRFSVFASTHSSRKHAIVVGLPAFKEPIPLCVLFRALGVTSDREILEHVVHDVDREPRLVDFLHHTLVDGNFLYTQTEALEFLRRAARDALTLAADDDPSRRFDVVLLQLSTDLFPATRTDMRAKARFLGDAVETLARTCVGELQPLDKDNLRYKRVDVTGVLLNDMFRDLYAYWRRNAASVLEQLYLYNFKGQSADKLITPPTLTRAFDASLMNGHLLGSLKGNWRVFKSPMELDAPKQGISQDLGRVTYMGTLSYLRRVSTPMDDSATKALVGPHRVQCSHWGMFCPTESPDGASIGLLKHFAQLAHVSPDCGQAGVRELIAPMVGDEPSAVRVRVNGIWIGTCADPQRLVEWVRLHRRNGLVSPYVSASWHVLSREVLVNTDAGRCCRPLLRVREDNALPAVAGLAWPDALRGRLWKRDDAWDPDRVQGYTPADKLVPKGADAWVALRDAAADVEFLDAEECETCLIASSPDALRRDGVRYTHCEIHPSTILSTVTGLLPFSNHTGSARNVLSCAQTKQGVGVYVQNFRQRMDNMAYVLHYPQRPIVTTRQYAYQRQDVLGHGENAIVAVLAYTGYNQEDAIIMNKSSVDRGLLSLTYYKTIVERESIDMGGARKVEFGNPVAKQAGGMAFDAPVTHDASTTIDDDGLPRVGARIREGDVVLGRFDTVVSETKDPNWERTTRQTTHSDCSLFADQTVDGVVDVVHAFQHDAKNKLSTAKVRLRQVRPPAVGDKCGSRHSQKGCIGALIPAHEMPFTRDGLVPDIIINPGGFPKRMTVAQLIEAIACKLGCAAGMQVDSTAFEPVDVEACCDLLETRYGMHRHGEEVLYNGVTGQQLQCTVLVTPLYSQRLKHMVLDKINARSRGGSTALTRQPNKGRSAGGGLRIGEMEYAAMLGHGAMGFLKESFMQRSDGFKFGLDERDEFVAPGDATDRLVTVPYAFKLLSQELGALGIGMRFATTDSDSDSDSDADADDLTPPSSDTE